ncbi:MAG: hypothetical protein KDD62_13175, partial [Bdellovibrionales bacterium]|nr:hypothetical protein [Bdellovibrionales bacterium]
MSRVLQMKDFDRNIPDPTIEGRGNFLAAEQFASRDNAPHAVQESDLNQYIRRNPLQISLSAREDGEIIFVTTTASAAVLQDQEGRSYLPKTQDELSYDSSIRASAIDRTGKLVAIAIDDMVG